MKTLRFALAGLALLSGLALWSSGVGRAQYPERPAYLQHFYNGSQPAPTPAPVYQQPVVRGSLPDMEPNQDILIKPENGQWVISIISYSGEQANQMARQMVMELRGPNYNLPAYVFNYAAERRKQEKIREDEMLAKMAEAYRKSGADPNTEITVRRRKMNVEDQCAVLVGGYNDLDTARRALDDVKRLKPPDPSRVQLEKRTRGQEGEKPGAGKLEESLSNPFRHSFVVHNPAAPTEANPERNKLDVGVLRKLNRGEDYTLLNCPKRFTLAVAGFSVPSVVVQKNAPSSFWDRFAGGKGDREDAAAHSAHWLADQLRKKQNVEAYVLHTTYSSLVTVGGYDNPNDPRLRQLQERFSRLSAHPAGQQLQLFSDPKPMEIPH